MSESIPCLIRTLAPVHLGADEVYEPLGFILDEGNASLVAFEPGDFLNRLPETERNRFIEICRRGTVESIVDIYRFYHQHRSLAQGRAVAVCPGLAQHYREVINLKGRARELKQALNQFTIHRTAYLPHDHRPYIPGSAVKGALRTAYLNALARIKSLPTPKDQKGRWDPRGLEQQLLTYRRIDEDPFRLLKVSDFLPVGEVRTRIVYAVNEKKKISNFAARGPYQILEVIEPGAEFWGTLTVELPPEEVRRSPKNKIRHFIAALDLWAAARTFYQQEKEKEDQALFEIGLTPLPLPEGDGLTPLRLGRHSGAECVTIAGHRKIKVMQAQDQPPKILDHATTLWLAADFHQRDKRHQAKLRPFGWALLAQLTAAELGELTARETHWQEAREKASAGTPPRPTPEIRPTPSPPRPPVVKMEVWEGARISWNPGKGEVTAEWQGKRAFGKGRELVPEALHKKVVTQKKSATARVTVDPEGFRILKIEAE